MKPLDDELLAERLFDGLELPQPPPELRERVLRVAQGHPAAGPLPDIWTRIWENPWMRLAWAASVLLLLAGNLLLVPLRTEPQLAQSDRYGDEEMVEFLKPLTIADAVTPLLGRSGGGRHKLVEIDEGGNAS